VHMHCEQCVEDFFVDCSWSSWSADAALFLMCSSGPDVTYKRLTEHMCLERADARHTKNHH
jgi:hypothetical protein